MSSLKDKTLDDLVKQINELSQRYGQALRMGKSDLANQIRMVLFSYQEEYQKRMAEEAEKAKNNKLLKDKVQVKK